MTRGKQTMATWKIIVMFRNGETITRYFDCYIEAVKKYVTYWNEDIIKAVLDKA
jgi:hypothetical protein